MNPRQAAYDALGAILRGGAYTSLALKTHLPGALTARDKRFAALLVRTTLENLLRIDYALDRFISSARVHGSVRNILRLGACQLLFMDTKGYAAVSESVALAKKRKPQTAGFVNGVLRALERGKDAIAYPQGDTAQALSIAYSYPLWICEKYIKDFGFDFTKALLSAKAPLTTHVRLNVLKTDASAFEAALDKMGLAFSRGDIDGAYAVSGLADIESLPPYRDGWLAVQSGSAMRATRALGLSAGDTLLDCCAAPGGKSAYAAALTGGRLDITAWDIREHRAVMMRKNFERLGVRARAEVRDACVPRPELAEAFDVVLVDAPCSAMGLMAHSPDIRYTRTPKDVARLCVLQKKLLAACAGYVKKGGKLGYMTCSVNKEENEGVVGAFLQNAAGFELQKPPTTLYPHLCGSDGFFYAVMERR